jgi:hypothetical protein
MDNVIFHPREPRILAVLDWELSTLGHPLADFAYHCMTWRLTPGQFRGMNGLDFRALGIPTEEEYVAAYCRRSGRSHIPNWDFYLAYNMFRLAGILQGIMGRSGRYCRQRVRDGAGSAPGPWLVGWSSREDPEDHLATEDTENTEEKQKRGKGTGDKSWKLFAHLCAIFC